MNQAACALIGHFNRDIGSSLVDLFHGGRRYLPLQDDISSSAFWYQTLPFRLSPKLP